MIIETKYNVGDKVEVLHEFEIVTSVIEWIDVTITTECGMTAEYYLLFNSDDCNSFQEVEIKCLERNRFNLENHVHGVTKYNCGELVYTPVKGKLIPFEIDMIEVAVGKEGLTITYSSEACDFDHETYQDIVFCSEKEYIKSKKTGIYGDSIRTSKVTKLLNLKVNFLNNFLEQHKLGNKNFFPVDKFIEIYQCEINDLKISNMTLRKQLAEQENSL